MAPSHDNSPPTYTAPSSLAFTGFELPDYAGEEKAKFKINGQKIPSLVHLPNLKAYLLILGAFHRLKSIVEEAEWFIFEEGTSLPLLEVKWVLFVERAVERFTIWVEKVVQRSNQPLTELPPLDVLLILHSYLLNPYVFHEDSVRLYHNLANVGDFPVLRIASTIDLATFEVTPTDEQAAFWVDQTQLPFDMPISTRPGDTISVSCPSCQVKGLAPWILAPSPASSKRPKETRGSGYAQNNFNYVCEACGFKITHQSLHMIKFATDLKRCSVITSEHVMATTLIHEPIGSATPAWGRVVTKKVVEGTTSKLASKGVDITKVSAFEIASALEWKLDGLFDSGIVEDAFADLLRKGNTRSSKFFVAYTSEQPFSTNLVTLTLRLCTFTDQAFALGWTFPGTFDLDTSVLDTAVERYHKFLDVTSQSFRSVMAPTLDIDLVFHAHMLNHVKYREDCKKYIGRVLEHHEGVEEGTFDTVFYNTADEWRTKHKKALTRCGCHIDIEPVSISLNFWKRKGKKPDDDRKAQVGDAFSDADPPDHPSAHNSVIIVNDPGYDFAKQRRQERAKKEQEDKAVPPLKKGKGKDLHNETPGLASSHHQNAFARPISGPVFGFRMLGPAGWALRGPFDPRVVEGSQLGRGIHVYGADPTKGVDRANAKEAALGWL